MVGAPAAGRRARSRSCTPPCSVNLKAFESRFFSTCCRRFESVLMLRSSLGSICTLKPRLRFSASWRNGRMTMSCEIAEEDVLGLDRDGAGFDLRQVEDVADQVEEVDAGAVDGAGELDLLRREVAVGVVGELLAEDQDAVQRRAQLVRHVGEELGFVLRGQRELRRLLLESAAGLLDLLVLRLDLDVALGELLRLLLELLVGLLQFPLPRLQLGRELLRLLQKALGLHRRLDAVQHDADAGGQLVEERDLQIGEGADRGQFDRRLDLALEQHRQHDDIARHALNRPLRIGMTFVGISVMSMRRASAADWPMRPSPSRSRSGWPLRRGSRHRSRAASGSASPRRLRGDR